MARFRVLAGHHAEESITNDDLKSLSIEDLRAKAKGLNIDVADNESDADKLKTSIKNSSLRSYKTGDVVDSRSDLLKLNSTNSRKFEKLDEPGAHGTPLARPSNTYSAAELQILATNAQREENLATQLKERQQAEKNNPSIINNPALNPSQNDPKASPPHSVTNQPPKTQQEAIAKLDQMSLKDLQQVAADEEVDLKGASKREDVLRILKQQLGNSK